MKHLTTKMKGIYKLFVKNEKAYTIIKKVKILCKRRLIEDEQSKYIEKRYTILISKFEEFNH